VKSWNQKFKNLKAPERTNWFCQHPINNYVINALSVMASPNFDSLSDYRPLEEL